MNIRDDEKNNHGDNDNGGNDNDNGDNGNSDNDRINYKWIHNRDGTQSVITL